MAGKMAVFTLKKKEEDCLTRVDPGALPPLASLTIVRVTNFTVYQKCKHGISDFVERQTGTSPLAVYNTPGSLPTFTGVSCFMASGMLAGLCAAPIACAFILLHKYLPLVVTTIITGNRSLRTRQKRGSDICSHGKQPAWTDGKGSQVYLSSKRSTSIDYPGHQTNHLSSWLQRSVHWNGSPCGTRHSWHWALFCRLRNIKAADVKVPG